MSTTAGIDIGAEGLRGLVLNSTGKGPVEVIAAGTFPLGELGRMPENTDKILAVGEKLKDLVKSARLKAATRRIAASGGATSIRYLQVPPVPPWRLDMLVKYEIDEKHGDKDEIDLNTHDYHILDVPEVGGQYTVMIGVCKEDAAHDLLTIGKTSGLGEVEIDLEALALYNAYYHGHGFDPSLTVLVADIGADGLTIILCRNGSLYVARTMLGGGRRFTQVLAEELKIDAAEAEELKKTQAEITFDITPATGRTGRLPRNLTAVLPRRGTLGPGALPPAPAQPAGENAPINLELPKDLDKSAEAKPAAEGSTDPDTITLELPPLDILDTTPASPPPPVASTVINVPSATDAPTLPALSSEMLIDNLTLPPEPIIIDDKRKRQMSAALVREAASICAALENTVMQCKQQAKMRDLKIDRIYLTGGGSKLKGLPEFINRRMRAETVPLEPFKLLSLDRLLPDQAEALKAEQHTMAVSVGLAVSNLKDGAFKFLLWPKVVKERKVFWARGAYLRYTAALVALTAALFLYTPMRNASALQSNTEAADTAIKTGQQEKRSLDQLMIDAIEKEKELKKITDNTHSGEFFLNLLAELKNKQRIHDDVYLTQITTNIPGVLKKTGGADTADAEPGKAAPAQQQQAASEDTFQVQRRLFIRGFIRASDKKALAGKIQGFINLLVPFPKEPDNPENLFKDIYERWVSPDAQQQGPYWLLEFVLEAYTEGTREAAKDDKTKTPGSTKPTGKPGTEKDSPTGKRSRSPLQLPPANNEVKK